MNTELEYLNDLFAAYGFSHQCTLVPVSAGLIHHTWKLNDRGKNYILQQINDSVFRRPEDIHYNIRLAKEYLLRSHPSYLFVSPIASMQGEDLLHIQGKGYFRVFPFIEGSHSFSVVSAPEQAYQAALQFGTFTTMLSGLDTGKLRITLPQFHDLTLRCFQFDEALRNGDRSRVMRSSDVINELLNYRFIEHHYRKLKERSVLPLRVMHHDTKISNVLFDDAGQGICVVDLDTIMPGYVISDLGDMMRTYLSPVSEEEGDPEKITIRTDIYEAISEGYREAMGNELTNEESGHFFFAGQFMIYMQALRFMTDHLFNDRYYGAAYEGHNYVRACNQLQLLKQYIA